MRETHDWADWELDLLEKWHALKGTAYVQHELARRGSVRGSYSVRHKASRLGLSHAMLEFTPLTDVAEEAGTTRQAVHQWLHENAYRRHCRTWGKTLLLPAPVVALYLNERRVSGRPRGWWGTARTADALGVHFTLVQRWVANGKLDAVQCGRTLFIDPYDVARLQNEQRRARRTTVKVRDLAQSAGLSDRGTVQALRRAGYPLTCCTQAGRKPALFVAERHARAFLSARGHHDEVVDTLLRRAVLSEQK